MDIVRKEKDGKTHLAKIGAAMVFAAVCCFLVVSYDSQPKSGDLFLEASDSDQLK